MKPRFGVCIMLVGALSLMGCARQSDGTISPGDVRPGTPADFRIENAQLLQAESWPVQVRLEVSGILTSPCHEVETQVTVSEENGTVEVEVTEEPIEGEDCPPSAEAFRESIPIGSFTSGDYQVLMNGVPVGELRFGATPVAEDEQLEPGPVYVDEAQLEFEGKFPVQVTLIVRGSLPTPCDTLYWASEPPNAQGQIHVEVYSLRAPGINCIQVLEPMEAGIPVGAFSEGDYSVWLNGELVGEFRSGEIEG